MQRQESHGNFLLLLSGQLVSKLGSSVYLVAVILYIKEITGSPGALGMFQFIAYLPIVLLTPLGGILADSANKKHLIAGSDIARGTIMILLGAAALRGALTFSLLLVGTFIVSSFTALFLPAAHALFPEIVSVKKIRSLNSVKSTSLLTANFAGTSIGGIAFAFFGPAVLFLANGISFILSAVPEACISYHKPVVERSPGLFRVWVQMKEQVHEIRTYLHHNRGLVSLLLAYGFVNSLYPPVILALPFLMEQRYGFGPQLFGIALALLLAGGGVGALMYGFFPNRQGGMERLQGRKGRQGRLGRENHKYLYTSLVFLALLLGLLLPIVSPLYLWLALPAAGAAIGVVHQIITTSLYHRISPSARGRIFGIMESMASFSVPLAYAGGGIVVQVFQSRLPLFFAIMGAAIAIVTLILYFFSGIGDFLSSGRASTYR